MSKLWQTVSVFISSTFRDMHSERDILVKQVFPKIREKLLPYRIRLIDIDLRWGITAEQAENDKTIEFCLDSIEGCRPFFIGILGERYGWIPGTTPGMVGERFPHAIAESRNSITAMEVIHGVLSLPEDPVHENPLMTLVQAFRDASGNNTHALFFFRDPAFEKDLPKAFLPVMVSEGPEHKQKLDLLKERIRKVSGAFPPVENYPCRYAGLSVDWDLLSGEAPGEVVAFMEKFGKNNQVPREAFSQASPVVSGWLKEHGTVVLDHLERFAEEVERRLWEMLCEAFPQLKEFSDLEANPLQLEDEAHQAVVTDLNTLFMGRDTMRVEWAQTPGGSLLVCTGQAGSGKSALLARLTADWQEHHPGGTVVVHFTGATASGANPDAFFNRILSKVCEATGQSLPGSTEPGFAANVLRTVVERIPAEQKFLIAVDGADLLYEAEGFDFRWIPETIPANIRILITMGDDHPKAAALMNQLSDCGARFLQIPLLRLEERDELIRMLPAIWAKTMDARQIRLLSSHPAANLPLFLTVALEELRKFGSYERLEKRIERFPAQTGEAGLILLYEQMLERLERELGRDVVEKPFRLLALSVTGLTESEIAGLCEDTEPQLLALLWRSLRIHLSATNGLLGFYHGALRQAIHKRYLSEAGTEETIHRQLAAFFSTDHDIPRALPELLVHHYALHESEVLLTLLTRLPNLLFMRRYRAGELPKWWDRTGVENPLKEIAGSLPEQVAPYTELLRETDRIALGFWTPVTGSKEILLYHDDGLEIITPRLDPETRDALMEVVRMVEESRLRNETTIALAVKLLAVMSAELGPVHARTLEVLATAIPLYFMELGTEDAKLFLTRAFMTTTAYLPDFHPVSVRMRMHVQDFFRKKESDRPFREDFGELMTALDSTEDCEKTREEEGDIRLREVQRLMLRAVLLTRHSQMLRLAGDIDEAVEYCSRTVEYCNTHLGPFHELSIQALNNLAMIHIEEAGDPATGARLMKEALALADSRVGKTSYLGLVLVNNLAAGLGNAGRFEEGLPWYREAVERKLAILGHDNESTLQSLYNLAWCYRNLNRFEEAIALCREVVNGFSGLGDTYLQDHLRMLVHLVEFLDDAGRREEASEILEPVIDRFYALPEDQQDWQTYLLLSGYLSRLLEENGDEEGLWELWENTLNVLMPQEAARPHLQNLYQRMNQWLTSRVKEMMLANDLQALQSYLDKLIAIHERLFGPDNEALLHWKVVQGENLNKLQRYDEAEPLLRDTRERLQRVKGPGDPETRMAAAHLAKALMESGRGEEGSEILMASMEAGANRKTDLLSMLTRMLQETEAQYGEEHPKTLHTLDEIARELLEKERPVDALSFLQSALERSERAAGLLDQETLTRAGTLAATLLQLNRPAEAEPVLRRIVRILEETKGPEDTETLDALEKLGNALVSMKEHAEAIAVFRKALAVSEQHAPEPDIRSGRLMARLFRLLYNAGEREDSAKVYDSFKALIERALSPDAMAALCERYFERAFGLKEERLNRAIQTIRHMQSQGKLDYLGDDPDQLRETAEHMTRGEVDEEHPEGAGEIEEWTGLLSWLDPGETELTIWSRMCDAVEQQTSASDPVRFLPRLRFCEWLMRYEGYDLMAEHLTRIWQEGDLQNHFVCQSGRLMFRLMAAQASVEEAAGVGQQVIRELQEALGDRHPALHMTMHEVARFVAGKQQINQATALYDNLIRLVSANLGEEHPFMKQLLAEQQDLVR